MAVQRGEASEAAPNHETNQAQLRAESPAASDTPGPDVLWCVLDSFHSTRFYSLSI